MYRVSRLVAVAAAIGVVFAAAGVAGGVATASLRNDKLTSVPPAPARIAPGDGRALFRAIPPPPSGAREYPVDGSTDGVLDVDQWAAKYDTVSTASFRRELAQMGFRVAAVRDWLETDGVEYIVDLVRFATADGAATCVGAQAASVAIYSGTGATFAVPGTTSGQGFHSRDLDAAGLRHAFLIARTGDVAVMMFVYTPGGFDRAAEVARFQAQITALSKL